MTETPARYLRTWGVQTNNRRKSIGYEHDGGLPCYGKAFSICGCPESPFSALHLY